jgi:hypothetical protein
MSQKRYKPEQIISVLREADVQFWFCGKISVVWLGRGLLLGTKFLFLMGA